MTPNLPPALADWQAWLSLFPHESASVIGPLVQPLAAAIGKLPLFRPAECGEPDGFDGLTRRGRYERLLMTEWVLAEAVPEEFLRRAASSEQLFLGLRRIEPAAARRALAFFDAGPYQLGAPRLVHLAALIVLARRAEAVGLPLDWGTAQQPAALTRGVTQENVMRLLSARTTSDLTEQDAAGLTEHLPSPDDDAWLVGSSRLLRFPQLKRFSQLWIDEPLHDEPHLTVTIHPRQGTSTVLRLDLPSEKTMIRLLRDPFATARTPPKLTSNTFRPASNLVFCQQGKYVFARNLEGQLIRYPVGNSPKASPGKPKLLPSHKSNLVFAAGQFKRGSILATKAEENTVNIKAVGKSSVPCGNFYAPTAVVIPSHSHSYLSPLQVMRVDNCLVYLMSDEHGTLFSVSPDGRANLLQLQTKAWAAFHQRLVWASHGLDGRWELKLVDATVRPSPQATAFSAPSPETLTIDGQAGTKACLTPNLIGYGLAALEMQDGSWMLIDQDGQRLLRDIQDFSVIGVTDAAPTWPETGIGLVAVDADRCRLWVIGYYGWQKLLLQVSAPVVSATLHQGLVALATEAGEFVVYSLYYAAAVYRLVTA